MRRLLLISATALGVFLSHPSPARGGDQELDGLAEQVARLRGDIETLDTRLEDQKESRRTQLRALAAQKSTLQLEIQREELRAKQLGERAARMQERARTAKERQDHLRQSVLDSAKTLKATLAGSIPFQIAERGAELDAISREVEAGSLLPAVAIERLWTWVDEENKLARESGIHQQVLTLNGEEVLADIARIGMVAMYFRAPGDRFGFARKSDQTWTWELLSLEEDRGRVRTLFTALEQGPGKGFFTLPGGALQ